MTQVQAVEGADADHTAVGAQGPAFDVAEQLVHQFSVIGMPGRRVAWLSAGAAEAASLCRTREVTGRARSLRRSCGCPARRAKPDRARSEEHTSALQSLMSISYAVFCLT